MELLIAFLILGPCFGSANNVPQMDNEKHDAEVESANVTDPRKDMYVIHAMVYQVGIITNKTDESNNTSQLGDEEALTFYHTNGSAIDLTGIPPPLLTNVTAQRLVAVAPVNSGDLSSLSWEKLKNLSQAQSMTTSKDPGNTRRVREINSGSVTELKDDYSDGMLPYLQQLFKRSLNPEQVGEADKMPVKIISGDAIIPQEAEITSLAIPPLLTLNNNYSKIPIPIPNTSVVHYAKVNTLIHASP